jgi:hypothetical protein
MQVHMYMIKNVLLWRRRGPYQLHNFPGEAIDLLNEHALLQLSTLGT